MVPFFSSMKLTDSSLFSGFSRLYCSSFSSGLTITPSGPHLRLSFSLSYETENNHIVNLSAIIERLLKKKKKRGDSVSRMKTNSWYVRYSALSLSLSSVRTLLIRTIMHARG